MAYLKKPLARTKTRELKDRYDTDLSRRWSLRRCYFGLAGNPDYMSMRNRRFFKQYAEYSKFINDRTYIPVFDYLDLNIWYHVFFFVNRSDKINMAVACKKFSEFVKTVPCKFT